MIEIRELLPSDREFLARLMDTCVEDMTYNAAFTRNRAAILRHVDRLMDPNATLALLGTVNGQPAGCTFGFLAAYFGTDVPFLLGTSVTILPEHRGSTLAVRLLTALHAKAKAQGVDSSVTHTMFADEAGTMDRLLRHMGYAEVGRAYRKEL